MNAQAMSAVMARMLNSSRGDVIDCGGELSWLVHRRFVRSWLARSFDRRTTTKGNPCRDSSSRDSSTAFESGLAIGAYGALGFLFAVRRKGANGKPSWLKRSQHRAKMWAADKFELDAFSAIPGVVLFAAAVFYYGALISPAALWVGGANYEGKRLFEKQACQTRAGATPTSIALADGSTLKGNIIERSDKLKALLTADAVVMVADGERGARIVESTSLGNIKCADK
ncbi:hypothetical protein LH706_06120 [Ralstonia pseudosolanacearum]|uniref:Transmembrane protein n=1 Tax=Ralstonia solanacearum TaxID=305 RepID=A0ABY6NHL3_RALSL|nr:hypothetical protein LH706_06120 [Ralstonia solanacearum]